MLETMMQLYEEGGSDKEVMKLLRILPKDFEKKLKTDKDFANLIEYGRVASEAWWLKLGRKCASNKGSGEYSFWALNMDHRFGWKKSSNLTVEEKEQEDPKSLLKDLNSRLKRISRYSAGEAAQENSFGANTTFRAS